MFYVSFHHYLDVKLKKGYCASFCHSCRGIHTMKVINLYKVPCSMFIPIWFGSLYATYLTCTNCKNKSEIDIEDFHVNKRTKKLKELIKDVPEVVMSSWEGIMAEDKRIESGDPGVPRAVRIKRIYDAFSCYEVIFEERIKRGPRLEKGTFLPFLFLFAFIGVSFVKGGEIISGDVEKYIHKLTGFKCITFLVFTNVAVFMLTFYLIFLTQKKRALKNLIFPKLAQTLYKMSPSADELSNVKQSLLRNDYKIGIFKINDFIRYLARYGRRNRL